MGGAARKGGSSRLDRDRCRRHQSQTQCTDTESDMENISIANCSVLHSRLADFFAHRTPWHRRLWSIGTVLGLREVVEYADACLVGQVANTEGLRFVASSAGREVDRDPGVSHLAVELRGLLGQFDVNAPDKVSRSARDELLELSRRADLDYCRWWQNAPEDVPVEFAARAIASHLLDAGFSADHLFRWAQAKGVIDGLCA